MIQMEAVDYSKPSRCRGGVLASVGSYRDVFMCDAMGLDKQEFQIRYNYFIHRVDEEYRNYYMEILQTLANGLLFGVSLWGALVAIFYVGKWIYKGASGAPA